MARTGERKIAKIAMELFGSYVRKIRIIKDDKGHPVMRLVYNHGYKVHILQTFPTERAIAGKFISQTYFINILDPSGNIIVQKEFLTAKMVKLAILKTKALDILKGASYGLNSKRSRWFRQF